MMGVPARLAKATMANARLVLAPISFMFLVKFAIHAGMVDTGGADQLLSLTSLLFRRTICTGRWTINNCKSNNASCIVCSQPDEAQYASQSRGGV